MVRNFSTGNVYGLANLRVSVVMLLTLSQIVEKGSSGILLHAPRETRIHEARKSDRRVHLNISHA